MRSASKSTSGKIVVSGRKKTVVPVPRAGPDLLQRADHGALLEVHLPLRAVAADGRNQLLRERVDDAGADAVEAAGGLVVACVELSSGMQRRENHLERALLRLRMLVDRYAAAVVCNRDRRAVLMQRDDDVRGIAVHRLVDRVVENLPDEMVEAGAANAADVHARALADGFEAFEDGDVFRCIGGRHSVQLIVSQDVSMPDAASCERECVRWRAPAHTIRGWAEVVG